MLPPPECDPRFDLLRFGLEDDLAQSRVLRLVRAIRSDFRATLTALGWWLAGARLRGAMRLRARIGDRLRWSGRIDVEAREDLPAPSMDILSGSPESINRAAAASQAEILLISTGDDCHWLFGSAERIREAFVAAPALVVLYGDTVVAGMKTRADVPLLAGAFDPDHFLAIAPIAPALAVRRVPFLELGGLASDLPEVECADFCVRAAARHGEQKIRHLPVFLTRWTWREGLQSPSNRGAVEDARRRLAARAAGRAQIDVFGVAHPRRELPAPAPKVSILVPTRDRVDLLRPCLDGLLGGTDYPDFEVIVIDNGSVEPATHTFFDTLARDERVRILRDEGAFNFSRLNNRAAALATGSVLVLLNNDISMLGSDWLMRMVVEAVRPEVGAVGAKLLYPSGLVQHGGVVLGLKGLAGHAHQFFPGEHRGYTHRLAITHRVAAVTAACLAVEKTKYNAVGGLDEARFAVALNDVDLCLKLDAAGWKNLFVPGAVLVHHESATRASDRSAGQLARWQGEVAAFCEKWPEWATQDPFYNPHFGQHMADFSLPRLRSVKG